MEKKIFIVVADWKCDGTDSQILGATFSLDKAKEIMAQDIDAAVTEMNINPDDEDWDIYHKEMSFHAINDWRNEWYHVTILAKEVV